MNTSFTFSRFFEYAPEIALVFSLCGAAAMLRLMLRQTQALTEHKQLVIKLHTCIAECAKDQIVFHDQVSSLQEQCASLHARQQRVEKHGSDTQRIDLAMRMLKRGNGDAAMLHDLGLSASEIKLLVRLHSAPSELSRPDSQGRPAAHVTDIKPPEKKPAVSPVAHAASAQGKALARLFKIQVQS